MGLPQMSAAWNTFQPGLPEARMPNTRMAVPPEDGVIMICCSANPAVQTASICMAGATRRSEKLATSAAFQPARWPCHTPSHTSRTSVGMANAVSSG